MSWGKAASTLTWKPRRPRHRCRHLILPSERPGRETSSRSRFRLSAALSIASTRRASDGRSQLDFDEAGERILVIGRNGLLFTWRIDGTDLEILPRPLVHGEVSRNATTAIGVAGGFVIVSRRQGQLMLAHYDFPTRTCRIDTRPDGETAESWVYYRDLHCVVGWTAIPAANNSLAVDLAVPSGPVADTVRSRIASKRAQKGLFPQPLIVQNASWFETDAWTKPGSTAVHLDPRSGTFLVLGSAGAFQSFTPMRDGRLALERGNILQARQAADVLAVLVEKGMRLVFIFSRCRAPWCSAPITTLRTSSAPAFSPSPETASGLLA